MSLDRAFIDRSEANWKAVGHITMMNSGKEGKSVAISRAYYSIFQLIKCAMVGEGLDEINTGASPHAVAKAYLKMTLGESLKIKYQELRDLRVQADYMRVPVAEDDYRDAISYWGEKRKEFIANMNSRGRLAL